jgi:hypothetical protein
MREVFVNQDVARVGYYKSVLDEAGIPNLIRNELSHSSLTDMPSPIFFPALCVLNDEDYPLAMELLGAIYYAPTPSGPDWICPSCGECVPVNFDTCWKCEATRTVEPKSQ